MTETLEIVPDEPPEFPAGQPVEVQCRAYIVHQICNGNHDLANYDADSLVKLFEKVRAWMMDGTVPASKPRAVK